MSPEDLVQLYVKAWEQSDPQAARTYCRADLITETTLGRYSLDEFSQVNQDLFQRIQGTMRADDIIGDGERFLIRWHERVWPADAPRPVGTLEPAYEGMALETLVVRRGEIVERWLVRDTLHYLKELGW